MSPLGSSLSEAGVADFLLSKRYYLAALELHQDLLESNNGVHDVARLNQFFNDPENFMGIAKAVEAKAIQTKASCESCRNWRLWWHGALARSIRAGSR